MMMMKKKARVIKSKNEGESLSLQMELATEFRIFVHVQFLSLDASID